MRSNFVDSRWQKKKKKNGKTQNLLWTFPSLSCMTTQIEFFLLYFDLNRKLTIKIKFVGGHFTISFLNTKGRGCLVKSGDIMPACWSVDDCLWLLLNHKREAGEYVLVPGGVTHSSLISPRISNAPLKFRLVYGVGYRMGGWGASDLRFLWDARPSTLENYTPLKIICVLTLETFVGKINMAFKVIKQKLPV